MSPGRVRVCAFGWCLAVLPWVGGCKTGPETIPPARSTDDFGAGLDTIEEEDEITFEAVQRREMAYQRAQVELRIGPSFPFDLFVPGDDPRHDNDRFEDFFDSFEGWAIGTKGQFEIDKNLYLGFAFDWSHQDVDNRPVAKESINAVEEYDRFTFVGGIDYDLPLWDDPHALLLRMGFGVGFVLLDLEAVEGRDDLEDIYNAVFRPVIGLRYPVHENIVLFIEASYDYIFPRTIATDRDQKIAGEDATFSSGTIWTGIAFQW